MKAGEYKTTTGQVFVWTHEGSGYYHGEFDGGGVSPRNVHPEDWPAARAALDALIEEEAGEWVMWCSGSEHARIWQRCRPDGSEMQFSAYPNSRYGWHDEDNVGTGITDAYRKGREVALGEAQVEVLAARAGGIGEGYQQGKDDCACCAHDAAQEALSELRVEARELVETINGAHRDARELGLERPQRVDWERVRAAAKALEGKL